MSEENGVMSVPKKIWNDTVKLVKGENTTQLMESFTAEMTLVAEGLCEDQNKLRGEVNRMMNEEDRRLQKQESRIQNLETALAEQERDYDQTLTELRNRLAALEKQENERKKGLRANRNPKNRSLIRDLTILTAVVAVAAIAVILVWKLV